MSKITIITNTFPPEFGAASNRLYQMAQGLRQAGHEVSVLTGLPNYPLAKINQQYKGKSKRKEEMQGITVYRYWVWASHSEKKWRRAWNMLSLALSMMAALPQLLKNKPDWLIVQYPPVALPLLSVLFAKLTGAKLLANFSDLWPMAMADLGVIQQNSWKYRLLEKIEAFVCKNAYACLAQSEEVYQHIQTKYHSKLLLYRTGADVSSFPPNSLPPSNPLPQVQQEYKPLELVYMGVLGMAQGVLDVCKNIDFAQLNINLHIYGDGLARKPIAEFISQNPSRGIILHPAVSFQEIPKILAGYDASLIPQKTRIRGTVPSKIYEAMAASLPIIFHGGGEGASLIEDAGCGWVSHAGNYEELQKHLVLCQKTSPYERYLLGQKGRETAVRKYDRQKIVKQLIEQLKAWENN